MIRVDRDGPVAVVVIDREEALNALDLATLTELRDRLLELAGDDGVRALVLTGAGKAFAAGADIKYMSGLDVAGAQAWGALGHAATAALEEMPKPVVAAINGFALGGGCELALACDLRYASARAKLGQPEINLAIVPGWGGTQRLARVCGTAVAKDLIFTGRTVGAEEALRVGLVHELADPVLERALAVAHELAGKSAAALALAKRLVNLAPGALAEEARGFGELFGTAETKAGLEAFLRR